MPSVVKYVTYARVARDAEPKEAKLRSHDDKLDQFLLGHAGALRAQSSSPTSCPANFIEDEGQILFESLRTGSQDDFLDAAFKLTARLIGQMNGATAEGLLVCLQIQDGAEMSAAVLKLQVVTPNAANLRTLDSGEVLLSAVTDVMEAPGKLQKGALVSDHRENSDVIMGDVANKEALYFPRAFGISIQQRASLAAADTLEIIRELHGDDVADSARRVLIDLPSGPVDEVLSGLGQEISELAPDESREAVRDRLSKRPRPVRDIDTSAPMKEIITASGVSITVPISAIDRVTVESDDINGGYVIRVRVDEEPRREVR